MGPGFDPFSSKASFFDDPRVLFLSWKNLLDGKKAANFLSAGTPRGSGAGQMLEAG